MAGFGNQRFHALQFLFGNGGAVVAEESGHGAGGRAFKERVEDVAEGGAAGVGRGDDGEVDVAWAVFAVADVAFVFEDAEEGADGGVAGGAGEFGLDFEGGGFLAAEEDVENLAFAAGKVVNRVVFFNPANFLAPLC